jgi:hypothetical protein
MKKSKFSMLAVLAIASSITFFSCKKEGAGLNVSDSPVIPATSGISAKNGRLVFKDEETFRKHAQWVFENQDKPQEIVAKYKQLGLSKSMMEVSLESDKLNDDTEAKNYSNFCKGYPNVFIPVEFENSILYDLQGSPSMAYLATTDGLFQIGNDIHRISYSYYYILKGVDESKIAALISAKGAISDPSITVKSTHSQTTRTNGYYITAYWSNNSKYRIVGESTYNYSGGVSQMYVKTTAQKKGWTGIWAQTSDINYVALELGSQNNPGYFIIDGGKGYSINYSTGIGYLHSSAIQMQVYNMLGQVDFSKSSCIITHTGIGTGNNNQTVGTISTSKDCFR